MGIFSEFFKKAGVFIGAAVYAIGTVAAYVGEKAVELYHVAKQAYNDYKSGNSYQEKRKNRYSRQDINERIVDLEDKRKRDGRLSEYEKHELDQLYARRKTLIDEAIQYNEMEAAGEFTENSSGYEDVEVDSSNIHIVQFHVGQSVSNKRCSVCGRPMTLQWNRSSKNTSLTDMFWGCTGYYSGACRATAPFQKSDARLFTNTGREEFQITAGQLDTIIQHPAAQQNIVKRMRDIKFETIEKYFCSEHGLELVLQEKFDPSGGLRDQFFLGCPMWKRDGTGCNYVMKIKSAAQLSSVLEIKNGRGLL
ncbi:MAG: hypothetical protein LCH52_01000 [Bacteroidetes bacterium]|nr:hypothetical protein [Bacteroidota bacterium]